MKNMRISKHVSLSEVIKSNTATMLGIDNSPTNEHLENLKKTCANVFEPLREYFGKPIGISSGYRSKALNKAIKGSKTSQHCKGQALDIDADMYGGITNMQIFNYFMITGGFDQLIGEFWNEETHDWSWVHVSYNEGNNRGEILTADKDENGKTRYIKYDES